MVKKNTGKNGKPSSAKKPKPAARKKPPREEEPANPLLDPAIAGHWVAWNRDRTKIIAVADTFHEIVAKTESMGEPEAELGIAPGTHPKAASRRHLLAPGESPDVLEDVRAMIPDADRWLDTPHWWFGGRTPREVIGTEEEGDLRNLLTHIRYGTPP